MPFPAAFASAKPQQRPILTAYLLMQAEQSNRLRSQLDLSADVTITVHVWHVQFPELGGGMPTHSMQGPFSPGSAPHSPAGPPGLMLAGPMHHPEYMHPAALGAGGQYIPIPMQVRHTSKSQHAHQHICVGIA